MLHCFTAEDLRACQEADFPLIKMINSSGCNVSWVDSQSKHSVYVQALLRAKHSYKKQALVAEDVAYQAEAAEEWKLRKELDALPKPGAQGISDGRVKGKGRGRKRKQAAGLDDAAATPESKKTRLVKETAQG